MNIRRIVLMAALVLPSVLYTNVSAKGKIVPEMYIFGFSASFKDSIIYFTDIQKIDSAWIDSKTKFLLGRDNYTYQLKNYFIKNQNNPNRTCVVIFDRKKKEIEKKYAKLRAIYDNGSKMQKDIRYISKSDFKFECIDMSYEEAYKE